MTKVGIIGGGIIGLSSAYYLNKSGYDVTVFDQGDLTDGCSFGNAGMIVPSHIIPLAAPGMVARGLRWMFDSSSPFYVKPRFSKDLLSWGYQFYRHANEQHVSKSIPALKEISLFSKAMYQQWTRELPFDFGYQERGLLMLYQRADTEKEEIETAHIANQAGVEAHVLSLSELQKLEPEVRVQARGGVYYPGDAQLIPRVLVEKLIVHLKQEGVIFYPNTTAFGFHTNGNLVEAIKTSNGDFEVETLVLATGSWSGSLCARLGMTIPMQAGKGYSFTLPEVKHNTRIPSIFLEARVAVTPMGTSLRFGGTMEIAGIDHSVNMNRVRGIVDAIPKYYPDMKVDIPQKENVWQGLRPCSPDGLPYIGRTRKFVNVIVATGHSMMGLSLGPGTGKLVSEIVSNEKSSISLHAFDPERFGD